MNEDESVSQFHIRLCDIANISFSLGEDISEEKLSKNIPGSLPKRFDMKVTEEALDLSSVKVDELIDFLQTFEMSINDRSTNKNKGIAFVSNTEEVRSQGGKEESLADDIALLGGGIQQFFEISGQKVEDKCPRQEVQHYSPGKRNE